MTRQPFTPLDEWRARSAFIAEFTRSFSKERESDPEAVKKAVEQLRLPYEIRQAIEAWLEEPRIFPGVAEPIPQAAIRVGFSSLENYPRARSTRGRYTVVDDPISGIEVEAANLSAAKRGAAQAVALVWERMGWPKNPQPYSEAERDVRMLFDWWCKRTPYDRIVAADAQQLTPEAVKAAVRRVRRLLGFRGERPRVTGLREAR